jgi:hypothetical protein
MSQPPFVGPGVGGGVVSALVFCFVFGCGNKNVFSNGSVVEINPDGIS